MAHKTLKKAITDKNDEFYTQLSDIEKELRHYKDQFKNKVIYCNADDPFESNFFKYFASNFNLLQLKKLIATSYAGSPIAGKQLSFFDIEGVKNETQKEPMRIEINEVKDFNNDGAIDISDVEHLLRHDKNSVTPLKGSGDFRSHECVEIIKEADIVVTNPPFSLFREYVAQLIEYDKKFLIIGNINAISYKEIFKLIKENKAWLGMNMGRGISGFIVPKHYELYGSEARVDEDGNRIVATNNCLWLTNLDNSKRHEDIILYKKYTQDEFPTYENYNAINVDKTKDIPMDYSGEMGVPITFLHYYNPDQFEIIDINPHFFTIVEKGLPKPTQLKITGQKDPYARILIKNKRL